MEPPQLLIGNQVEHVILQPTSRPTHEGWLNVLVSKEIGGWQGRFEADFLKQDFSSFRKKLQDLYDAPSGQSELAPLEPWIELRFLRDKLGHIRVEGSACDAPGTGSTLEFQLENLDQTFIPTWLGELDKIIEWLK